MAEDLRLFFAIWPDAAARRRIATLADELRREAGGRATAPERTHLTLAFLGDTPADRLEALRELASGVEVSEFSLLFDQVDSFARQRLVWLGAGATPAALAALVEGLNAGLKARGFRLDRRAFLPHLTLLRDARRPLIRPLARPIAWRVTEFTLVSSRLVPPVGYQVLARFALPPTVP